MHKAQQKQPMMVLAAGIAIQICTGIPAAWGVFQQAVSQEYALSEESTALVFSFMLCFFGIGCIAGGFLQDSKGPCTAGLCGAGLLLVGFMAAAFVPAQQASLLYGLFSAPVGLGCAFLYPAVMSCAQKWYTAHKGLATGIIGGAVGLSGAFLTFTGRFLIKQGGIRSAFWQLGLLLGGICALASLVLKNPPSQKQSRGESLAQADYTVAQMLKTKQYWLVLLIVCLATPSVLLFSPQIVEMAQQRGLSEQAGLACIWLGAVFAAAGRISMPWLSDHIGRRSTDFILFGALTGLSIWFWRAQGCWLLAVYCMLIFCYAGEGAVLPSMVTDLFGQGRAGVHYGLAALGMSVGSVGFPLIAHALQLQEARHFLAAGCAALGFVLLLALKPTRGARL